MRKLGIFCASLFLAAALPAQVTQVWIDGVNGSDTNPGTQAKPFKTLTKGLVAYKTNVVIHIMPAVYGPKTTGDFWDPATKKGKHIDLRDCKNYKIIGVDRDKCILDFTPAYDQFWGFIWITGSNTNGVEITNLTLRNVKVPAASFGKYWGCGPIMVHGGAGKNIDIHGNFYLDCTSFFIAWNGTNVAFHDNVLVSTNKSGVGVRIRIGKATESCYVYNNVFYNTGQGVSWSGNKNLPKQWVCNNIALNCGTGFPNKTIIASVTLENNIAFGNTSNFALPNPPKSNLTVDPKLVNPAKYDFRQQAGSPCLDAGYPMGLAMMMNDYYGNARAADGDLNGVSVPDIGAQEVVQGTLSVSNFAQGKTAVFQAQKVTATPFTGFFFLAYGKGSLVLSPYGIFGLDPTKILVGAPITFPGQYQLPIPNNPLLKGVPVYAQALGFRPTTGGFVFMPTGRLDLYL